ncbi:MAG: hypothetical protein KDB00_05935 [Planctomycetales bacterium]|nr:hypothetical protein [Planctomycetales bacterium]
MAGEIKHAENLGDSLAATSMSVRKRLPDTRKSITHKFEIGELTGYVSVGVFDDRRPGELFIKVGKEGSTIRGLLDSIGIVTSLALQYGVPVSKLAEKLSHVQFEPSGITKNQDIPIAKSIVDYVFRWLGKTFGDTEVDESDPSPETHQSNT